MDVGGLPTHNYLFGSDLFAVSCASAGNCSAGGNYALNAKLSQAFVVSETNGKWGKAQTVPGFTRRDAGYIENITTGQRNINAVDVHGGHLSALWDPSDAVSLKLGALLQNTDGNGSSVVDTNSLLQPTLGLNLFDGAREVAFYQPMLPAFIDQVQLRNLRLGGGSVDVLLRRDGDGVAATVTRRDGDLVVVVRQ